MRGNIRWRNGAWRLQVFDAPIGRFRTRTVRSPNTKAGRKIADAELARLVLDVEGGRPTDGDDITVADLLDRWVRLHAADWSPKTLLENRRQIASYLIPELGHRPISEIRAVDLDRLYARIRAKGVRGKPLKPASVRKVHNIAHAAFTQAVRWGLVATNPADAATAPKVSQATISAPAPPDIIRLIEGADADLATFVRLAATTGARRGQLIALRWTDIDLDTATITFSRAITTGESGLVEKGTKTDRPYTVALDPATTAALKQHRIRQAERHLALGHPATASTPLFTRATKPILAWHPDGATQRFAALRHGLKLDGVILKNLRHAMATQMLAAGVDIRTVSGRLGHANPYVTLRTYAQFLPVSDRAAADTIAELLQSEIG